MHTNVLMRIDVTSPDARKEIHGLTVVVTMWKLQYLKNFSGLTIKTKLPCAHQDVIYHVV